LPNVTIPGAPPVTLASVATIFSTPFWSSEMRVPTALSFSVVPAASAPELYESPSCVQVPAFRLYRRSCGAPLFQNYIPR